MSPKNFDDGVCKDMHLKMFDNIKQKNVRKNDPVGFFSIITHGNLDNCVCKYMCLTLDNISIYIRKDSLVGVFCIIKPRNLKNCVCKYMCIILDNIFKGNYYVDPYIRKKEFARVLH